MKIVGASTPGIAAPGTRRISLSARRTSAPMIGQLARSRVAAAFRAARGRDSADARPPRAPPRRRAPRGPAPAEIERDDRVAQPVGDVAQRVVAASQSAGGSAAAPRGKNALETNRMTKTSGKIPWTVEALRARSASSTPIAPKPDAGQHADRQHDHGRPGTPPSIVAPKISPSSEEPDDLHGGERGGGEDPARARSPTRGIGEATSRSKKPPSISSAVAMPADHAAEQQRLRHRGGELEVQEAVDLGEARQVRRAVQPADVDGQEQRGEDDQRREELRAAERVAQRPARERQRGADHARRSPVRCRRPRGGGRSSRRRRRRASARRARAPATAKPASSSARTTGAIAAGAVLRRRRETCDARRRRRAARRSGASTLAGAASTSRALAGEA